ncbi:MAG: exodeoxyribonuclease V subunit alpha [Planctomycetota bacterium]
MTARNSRPAGERLSPLELEIARSLLTHSAAAGTETEKTAGLVALAGALVQRAMQNGHTAVTVDDLSTGWPDPDPRLESLALPERVDRDQLAAALAASPLVGSGEETSEQRRPLILRAGRLAFHRNFALETRLERELTERSDLRLEIESDDLKNRFQALFASTLGDPNDELDGQALAAVAATSSALTVVLGGPGTGKTTTVARVLALLRPQRLGLAAPTGKAAARLTESLRAQAREFLPDFDDTRMVAKTVHSLLEVDPRNGRFRRNRRRPLGHDLLVVDEASMLDTETFTAILEAVPRSSRIILLGDPDQLPSIGPGQVLRDLANEVPHGAGPRTRTRFAVWTGNQPAEFEPTAQAPRLSDLTVKLTKTYRFDETKPLGALARAVRDGHAEAAIELLRRENDDLEWHDEAIGDGARLAALAGEQVRALAGAESNEAAFEILSRQQVLGALHDGPEGITSMNRGLGRLAEGVGRRQPRIVNVNDHALGVFNGDLGLMEPEQQRPGDGNSSIIEFRTPEGASRRLAAHRLPPHEPAWAITIHKSQGSEFDEVVVVLPENDSELLTRELLYTAITRARHRVRLIATEGALRRTIDRRTIRTTGLAQQLSDHEPSSDV